MFAKTPVRTLSVFFLVGGSLLAGCGGSSDPVVNPTSILTDRATHALTNLTGSTIVPKVLKGSYSAGCKAHGGQNWDLTLNDPTDRSLEVVLNDTFANCQLKVTAVQVLAGSQLTDYPLATPLTLGRTFAAAPVMVNQPNPTSFAFYMNAKFSLLADDKYANDFNIDVVYSDDAQACKTAPPAIYAKVTATAIGSSVPAPNYGMTFDNLKILVDANLVVQNTSSGNVVLKLPAASPQVGEQWKLFDEASLCCDTYSFAVIDTMFRNVTAVSSGMITGNADVTIPWSGWDLVGKTLPKSRWLVIKHTDGGGVYSYELFQVVFPGPLPL